MPPHPIQPLWTDPEGIVRFRHNQIVNDLLDFAQKRGFGMNSMAYRDYSPEDRRQFAQLIGYSLSGYGELRSYVDDVAYALAETKAKNVLISEIEIERDYYRKELMELKKSLQKPMARLFGVHPDDLACDSEKE